MHSSIAVTDLEARVRTLQEEVADALDESRRSKLYCQQVRKELHDLVSTEYDRDLSDETFDGMAKLLGQTSTLVEKFVAFELHLRGKFQAELQDRDDNLSSLHRSLAESLVRTLQSDIRETLVTFKNEIIELRQFRTSITQTVADLTAQQSATQQEILQLKDSLASLQSREMAGLAVQHKQAAADIDVLKETIAETKAYLQNQLDNQRREAAEAVGALNNATKNLQQQVGTTSTSHGQELTSLQQQITDANARCSDTAKREAERRQNELDDLHKKNQKEFSKLADKLDIVKQNSENELMTLKRQTDQRTDSLQAAFGKMINEMQGNMSAVTTELAKEIRQGHEALEEKIRAVGDNEQNSREVHASALEKNSSLIDQRMAALVGKLEANLRDTEQKLTERAAQEKAMLERQFDGELEKHVTTLTKAIDGVASDLAYNQDALLTALSERDRESAGRSSLDQFTFGDPDPAIAVEAPTPIVAMESRKKSVSIVVTPEEQPEAPPMARRKSEALKEKLGEHFDEIHRRVSYNEQGAHRRATLVAQRHEMVERDIGDIRDEVDRLRQVFVSVFGGSPDSLQNQLNQQKDVVVQEILQSHVRTLEKSLGDVEQRCCDFAKSAAVEVGGKVSQASEERLHLYAKQFVTLQNRVTHSNALLLKQSNTERTRRTFFHQWGSFITWKRAKKQRAVEQRRRMAVDVIERTIVPRISAALRRSAWATWKRFLVFRRQRVRQSRLAVSMSRGNGQLHLRKFYLLWRRFVREVRRPQRVLQLLSKKRPAYHAATVMARWRALVKRKQELCLSRRFLAVLSIAQSSGLIGFNESPLPAARGSKQLRASPLAAAINRRLGLRYFSVWANRATQRIRGMLREGCQRALSQTDNLTGSLVVINNEVRLMHDSQSELSSRIAALIQHSESDDEFRQNALQNPLRYLQSALHNMTTGYGSYQEVFWCLALWADTVDRDYRGLRADVEKLYSWVTAIDNEIRNVQKFMRPPFK